MQPLLVHLIFHPNSSDARGLAHEVRELFEDAAVPGLRVPMVFTPTDGSEWPPLELGLDDADRNFLVLLADDEMVVQLDEPPPGRQTWASFAGDLYDSCKGQARRWFMPVSLSASAWPLDERLRKINFQRANLHPAGAPRATWLTRHLLIQLYQALAGEEPGVTETAPIKLFISHAKQDFTGPGSPVGELLAHLEQTQPITTWVDSAKIKAGSDFAQAIEAGVAGSSVLAVVTDSYSSRPWCRREILLTKQKQRPLVVLDALETRELRAFPYLGNTPVRRWVAGDAEQCIDLILKESLRVALNEIGLRDQANLADQVLTSQPELATLVGLAPDRPILYPDPPLGDEELELLAPMKLDLSTPLLRIGRARNLKDIRIALSAGNSPDLERRGLDAAHLEQAMLGLCQQLLVRGATLAYGGHLDPGGYTAALLDLALAHQNISELPPFERIHCFLAWSRAPKSPAMKALESRYQGAARYILVPRPPGLEELDPARFVADLREPISPDSGPNRYAVARSMTLMREQETAQIDARVVVGGKLDEYSGVMPGILEEVLLTMKAKKPTYVIGAFGGAAGMIADLLAGKDRPEMTWDFHQREPHIVEMRALYQAREDGFLDYPEMLAFLRERGSAGLGNGLSDEQNRVLWTSRDLGKIVALVIEGLLRTRGAEA